MTEKASNPPGWRGGRGLLGGAAVIAGLSLLGLVAAATYGEASFWRHLSLRLGLGGSTLLAAVAEAALVAGGWLLWAALRPADQTSNRPR